MIPLPKSAHKEGIIYQRGDKGESIGGEYRGRV